MCTRRYFLLHNFDIEIWVVIKFAQPSRNDSLALNVLLFTEILAQIYSLSACELIEILLQV